jgi:hypothetical protein
LRGGGGGWDFFATDVVVKGTGTGGIFYFAYCAVKLTAGVLFLSRLKHR